MATIAQPKSSYTAAAFLAGAWQALSVDGERPVLRWPSHLVTMLMGTWLMVGLFVDGWAHVNLRELETFFTPWHALFYSGFAATSAWMGWLLIRELRAGRRGLAAVPRGYELGFVGVVLFAIGGFGDMLWHIAFGIEQELNILLSPTHLLLLTAMALILSSPFRAAWSDPDSSASPSFRELLPTVLSLTLVVALFSLFTMYLSAFNSFEPFVGRVQGLRRMAADADAFRNVQYLSQRVGLGSILLSTVLLLSPLLLMLRRWHLPFGSATILFTLSTALVSALEAFRLAPHILTALFAGIVTDFLVRALRPSSENVTGYRAFATAVPLVLWTFYMAVTQVRWGIVWSLEMSSGIVTFAGLAGLVLSTLILPPAVPETQAARPGEG